MIMNRARFGLRAAWVACAILLVGIGLVAKGGHNQAVRAASAVQPMSGCGGGETTYFSDINASDWFYPFVTDLADMNAISGYSDGTFRPNNTVTRGQMVKIIVLVANLTAN